MSVGEEKIRNVNMLLADGGVRRAMGFMNIALMTEGGIVPRGVYKHRPPDGGRACLRNWFYKHCPPDGGRACLRNWFYKHCPPDGGLPSVSVTAPAFSTFFSPTKVFSIR